MYVKRELARVLYYDMFEKGRVVIKQGKRIDNVEKVTLNLSHVRESKTVVDTGFHTTDSGFQLSVELDYNL